MGGEVLRGEGEGNHKESQRPLCLILRSLCSFSMVMENHRRTDNASIGILGTNNQCTHKYIIPNDNQSEFPVYDESLKGF